MEEGNRTQQTADSNGSSEPLAVDRAAPAPPLYDIDIEQRMPFETERRGVMYPVAHIFGQESLKDAAILEFERARDQRLTDAESVESDEKNATAITNQSYRAAVEFSKKFCIKKEGYAGKSSEKDDAFAVQNLLFGAEFKELPIATSDQPCPEEDVETSTYILRCISNGTVIDTRHTMKAATTDQIGESQILLSRTLIVQGTQFGQRDQRIPSKMKRWGELYDLMKESADRYARKIPLHHKALVAQRHLQSSHKAITGNSAASPR